MKHVYLNSVDDNHKLLPLHNEHQTSTTNCLLKYILKYIYYIHAHKDIILVFTANTI